ncbi:MAG: ATP-binding protein, partial [Bacteroidetes bacterium]|nr:ATP-binding protein [Bacteroidota bacterium]
ETAITSGLQNNPVVAILGPRQCGKSTLAKHVVSKIGSEVIYLDLERPTDLQKLSDAEWFLSQQKNKLVCLDEIQRKPELFPLIRSLVDEWKGNSHFLILGSASRDLLMQSSESLAGRISYKYLTPFLFNELPEFISIEDYIIRGGFPRSLFAANQKTSFEWREDFITSFLERDLLLWSGFSSTTMRKLWQMLAHLNGQVINYSKIATALSVSNTTAKNYIELLSSTFMIRLFPPFLPNLGKRLIKSPKVYLNDTGIIHSLIGIRNFEHLSGHPSIGMSWESLVISNLAGQFPGLNFYFYRTNHGSEIDIVVEFQTKKICIECKASLTPKLEKGSYTAISDLKPEVTFIVAPVKEGWSMKPGIEIVNLIELTDRIHSLLSF